MSSGRKSLCSRFGSESGLIQKKDTINSINNGVSMENPRIQMCSEKTTTTD